MHGSEVNGGSSLHFLQDDAKSVNSRRKSINSTHTDRKTCTLFLFLLHKILSCVFFLIPKITGLCLVSCAVSFSLGTAEGGSH